MASSNLALSAPPASFFKHSDQSTARIDEFIDGEEAPAQEEGKDEAHHHNDGLREETDDADNQKHNHRQHAYGPDENEKRKQNSADGPEHLDVIDKGEQQAQHHRHRKDDIFLGKT